MADETLRWKLFSFSLKGQDKKWYNRHVRNSQGDWDILRKDFCLKFFLVEKVAKLRFKIIGFKQLDNESLGKAWDRFDGFVNSGPNLTLPEPILLQHFFLGLDDRNKEYLNLASGGALMHITVEHAKTILTNILNDLPKEKEELLEEESLLAKNKLLPNSSQSIVELNPKLANEKEITPIFEWMFEIEDDFFDDYGNTTFYRKIIQPRQSRDFNPHFSHPDDSKFFREITRELVFILGDDWLIESEQSPEVIHFNSLSVAIKLQVDSYPFEALYNPVVGVNIMSYTFA